MKTRLRERTAESRNALSSRIRRLTPRSRNLPYEKVIATPTMKGKKGKIRSVGVQPCHSACLRGGVDTRPGAGVIDQEHAGDRKSAKEIERGEPAGGRGVYRGGPLWYRDPGGGRVCSRRRCRRFHWFCSRPIGSGSVAAGVGEEFEEGGKDRMGTPIPRPGEFGEDMGYSYTAGSCSAMSGAAALARWQLRYYNVYPVSPRDCRL